MRKIKLTSQDLKDIKNAKRSISNPQLLKHLQAIQLKNKQWIHKDIAEFLGVTYQTISMWIKIFFEKGIAGLTEWKYK